MYAYLKGILTEVNTDSCVIEVNDIGYNIYISQSTMMSLPPIGNKVMLYTYTYVKEDAFELLGFHSKDDLAVFKDLISVSGVGTKTALSLLSIMNADSIRLAIVTGDVKSLSKAPGFGKKTAERVIVDLKSKYGSADSKKNASAVLFGAEASGEKLSENFEEAADALSALGFARNEVISAIKGLGLSDDADVDLIISEVLKVIR